MAVAITTCTFLVVCALSCAPNSKAASVGLSSVVQAERRLNELGEIMSNIKNSLRPRHCNDILHVGQKPSGLYTIFPLDSNGTGQTVYCDMDTDGGGWTVIQRRGQFGNNVYYFYRNWTEYTKGFGDPDKEYWIGNNVLNALTSGTGDTTLRIVLTNGRGQRVSLDYESFRVGSEEELFKLKFGKYVGPQGWNTLQQHHDVPFSTYDRDNDRDEERNCAKEYPGGWWYTRCLYVNLNGLNLNGLGERSDQGIVWWRQFSVLDSAIYSFPGTVMMIRTNGTAPYDPLETTLD